jgi:predicted Zn-dependent peptidase
VSAPERAARAGAAGAVATGGGGAIAERITRLANGLTIATDHVPGARSAAIGVWVAVGARDEPPELSGVCHFLEHLLFKGTPTRTASEISRTVDRVGGDINAFTSKEYTSYYCRMPRRHAATGIELLGDVLTRSLMDDHDVESERQVILEELAMDDDSPDDVAMRAFAGAVFDGHALGRDTAGDRKTVSAIAADDIRSFHAAHYRAANTIVSIAGDVDHDESVAAVERALVDLPDGDGRIPRSHPDGVGPGRRIHDDTEQVHLVVGGRAVARDDPDREALDVVNHILGGGLSSRLFDEIRERRGLAYSVYSAMSTYADTGMWSVYAGTLPEHVDTVRVLIADELERLVADGITDEELSVAVGYLVGAYEMGLEDTGARMSRLGGMLVTRGEVIPVDEQLRRWEKVQHADVRRVLDRVFGRTEPITVSVGPGA